MVRRDAPYKELSSAVVGSKAILIDRSVAGQIGRA